MVQDRNRHGSGVADYDFFRIVFFKFNKNFKICGLNLRMIACCLTSLSGSFFLFVGGVFLSGAGA